VGPSITVTSLTNALAFGIGAVQPTPVIQSFCVCVAVAMTLCFVYELTFFAAILVLVDGKNEDRKRGADDAKPTVPVQAAVVASSPSERHTSRSASGVIIKRPGLAQYYARVVISRPVIVGVLVSTVVIWAVMINGVHKIKTDVSIEQILPRLSPVLLPFHLVNDIAWTRFYPVGMK
jgi:predicted RND superfamily exporter protein